jgi:hypothetical protein
MCSFIVVDVVDASGTWSNNSKLQCAPHTMRPHVYLDLTSSLFIQFWP